MKRIRIKYIILTVIIITIICLVRGCYNIFENCAQEVFTSPKGTNTIIVQYNFVSSPTVYKKGVLWDKKLWSYQGGFMETVYWGVEWLSEDKFRISYEDVKNKKYNKSFVIEIP